MKYLGILAFCLLSLPCLAQFTGFSALFRPGVRLGAAYQPSTSDSVGMSLVQGRASLIVPIAGKAEFKPTQLKASASQHFLLINGGARRTDASIFDQPTTLTNFSVGLTGGRVGLLTGIVGYGAIVGAVSHPEHGLQPFAAGGVVKVFVRGIHKQNFFGFGAVYGGKRLLPVPIVGIRRKLAERTHVTLLLPMQADITYNLKKGSQLVLMAGWNSYGAQIGVNRRLGLLKEQATLSLAQIKSTLTLNWRVNRSLRFMLEGGATAWGQLAVKNERFSWSATLKPTAYVGASLRMNLGFSLISSQLFGVDM